MITKKLEDYLKTHRIFYKPNFGIALGVSLSDTDEIIKKLIRDGRVEKVHVPSYYSVENSENVFLESCAVKVRKITKKMIKEMEDYDGYTNEDLIEWHDAYLVK